jgi:hypothetical protein
LAATLAWRKTAESIVTETFDADPEADLSLMKTILPQVG